MGTAPEGIRGRFRRCWKPAARSYQLLGLVRERHLHASDFDGVAIGKVFVRAGSDVGASDFYLRALVLRGDEVSVIAARDARGNVGSEPAFEPDGRHRVLAD